MPSAGSDKTEGVCRIIAQPEERCERYDAYGEDDHHGAMDLVDADRARDRKQQQDQASRCGLSHIDCAPYLCGFHDGPSGKFRKGLSGAERTAR